MPRILLVEDNEMNREMLARRLMRRGFEVVEAIDGQKGVEAALSHQPDLILMDVSLPLIDGWEATARLKSLPEMSRTPIIILTAHATSDDRERSRKAGCDEYETKPVDFPRLIQKIETLLAKGDQSP